MASGHGRKPPNPQRAPKSHGKKPPAPKPHRNSGSSNPRRSSRENDPCCPMVAAVQSVKRGKFRLARRYAAMSVRLTAARMAGA